MTPLVEIRDLYCEMVTFDGVAKVLNGINLTINKGDLLGVVGETGCGKSVTAMSIPRLVPQPPARYPSGQVLFNGQDVLKISTEEVRELRARKIGVVFQDPMTGLNPVFTIEEQMVDSILARQNALHSTGWGRGWLPSAREERRADREGAVQL